MQRRRSVIPDHADVIAASLTRAAARDILVDARTAYPVARVALASAQGAITAIR